MKALICLLVALVTVPALACAQDKPPAKPAEPPKAEEAKLVEVVPDLPDFPNAAMASYEEKGARDGWTKTWKRETRATAPYPEVKKFYLEQFEKKGWKVSTTKEKPGEIEWGITKGASWGRVEIDSEIGMVKVTVERKDR
jgi:hypothetical protein